MKPIRLRMQTWFHRGNETLRLRALIPASLLALALFLEADTGWTAHTFKLPGRYVTPHRDISSFHWIDYTCDSERGHAHSVSMHYLVPLGNHGYIHNLPGSEADCQQLLF